MSAPVGRGGSAAGVVFDLDGVLVDSRAVMEAAFAHAHRVVVGPGPPPFDRYVTYLGWAFGDIMEAMGLPASMEQPFVEESERLVHEVRAHEGIEEVLVTLRAAGRPLAVATGKARHRADRVLAVTGLDVHLDAVVGSDEVAAGKPAPDIFLEATARIGVAPEDALVVGDAVADIAGARAAGIVVGAALWGESDRQALLDARPDVVFDRPADILTAGLGTAGR